MSPHQGRIVSLRVDSDDRDRRGEHLSQILCCSRHREGGTLRPWGISGHSTTVCELKAWQSQVAAGYCPGFQGGSDNKASDHNAGDLGSIPGSGRSPGEGNGDPLQYSCLENPMDGGGWWATVHGVTKSRTGLGDFTFTFFSLSRNRVWPAAFWP